MGQKAMRDVSTMRKMLCCQGMSGRRCSVATRKPHQASPGIEPAAAERPNGVPRVPAPELLCSTH
eukprot:6192622-Pleurochrysis_carterae.AAC.3